MSRNATAVSASELAELFLRAAHRLRRASFKDLAPLGVTPAQARALRTVMKFDRAVRMGEIAAQLDVAPRSATGLIDGLEQAGLVTRTTDPNNRRSVLVELTDDGRQLAGRMAEARRTASSQLFDRLNASERQTLHALVSKALPPEGQ